MTKYAYDPDLPFAVAYSTGDKPLCRFRTSTDAENYLYHYLSEGVVIDTTPKPKIPEDAEFITWHDGDGDRWYAEKTDRGLWLVDDGMDWTPEGLADLLEDAKVTVLVPKEES